MVEAGRKQMEERAVVAFAFNKESIYPGRCQKSDEAAGGRPT